MAQDSFQNKLIVFQKSIRFKKGNAITKVRLT